MRDRPAGAEPQGEAAGILPPGFRLPPGTGPGAVHLAVADLERSLSWYGGVLGLRVLATDAGSATLGGAAPLVHLREQRGARPAGVRRRLGLYHFALLLPDRAALGGLVRHLAGRGERFGASDHLVSEALYLSDPDGLGVEVYADRPRARWCSRVTARGRELEMATAPLDLDSVAAAADGAAWPGTPPATRLGHLHLHVGELPRALDFYHRGLGLSHMVWSYPGAAFLSAGGYHHHLGINTWAGPEAVPAGPDDARLLAWTLAVPADSVDAAAASLRAAGFAPADAPGAPGFSVADPWGTRLRVEPA